MAVQGARNEEGGLFRAERRQATRSPVEMWVEEISSRELYLQRSANISTGGIYLERTVPHAPGTRVRMRFTLPGDSTRIEVDGRVVNVDEDTTRLGMGVAFVAIDAGARQCIADYVDRRARGKTHETQPAD